MTDRRRSDRRGYEKLNYELHVSRVKDAKGTVDCRPPRPHPLTNRGDMDQVSQHFVTQSCNLYKFPVLLFVNRKYKSISSNNVAIISFMSAFSVGSMLLLSMTTNCY